MLQPLVVLLITYRPMLLTLAQPFLKENIGQSGSNKHKVRNPVSQKLPGFFDPSHFVHNISDDHPH